MATPRADGGAPSALVFLAEEQAGYLDLELHGGTRRAGDVATTRLGPLVPGPKAPRDRFGGLPRTFVADALQDPAVAWVTLRKGEPPALVRKRPGQPMEVLAVIMDARGRTRFLIQRPVASEKRPFHWLWQ